MKLPVKHIRASVFGLVAICFLLPFVVVSCPDYGKVSVSGVELAFGTTIKGSRLSSVTEDQRIKPQVYALLAFAAAIAGIVCSYLKKKPAFIACIVVAFAGIAFLALLRNQIAVEAARRAAASLKVRYEAGYWIATAGFVAALGVTLLLNPFGRRSLLTKAKRRR